MDYRVPVPRHERRREARHPVTLNADVRLHFPDRCGTVLVAKATIENLNLNGARIHIRVPTIEQIPILDRVRSRCSVVCELPDVEFFSFFAGSVVWMDVCTDGRQPDIRLGIQFVDVLPAERHRLEAFFEALMRRK